MVKHKLKEIVESITDEYSTNDQQTSYYFIYNKKSYRVSDHRAIDKRGQYCVEITWDTDVSKVLQTHFNILRVRLNPNIVRINWRIPSLSQIIKSKL